MSKFCFDLDEVLVEGDLIKKASEILLKENKVDCMYTGKDVTSYTLAGIPQVVRDKTIELFSIPKYAVWAKRPIQGVRSFLELLRIKGHETYIVTARPATCHKETVKYAHAELGVDPEKVHCVGPAIASEEFKVSKIPEIAGIDPDYYFDDNVQFCEEADFMNIETYLVANAYTPWNCNEYNDRIHRIKNICFFPYHKI
ncbi:MAG: hypothetical protein GY861_11050 [bacterium]|nr:hypothetical protein [bacterium]